jgi:hypothetical protein
MRKIPKQALKYKLLGRRDPGTPEEKLEKISTQKVQEQAGNSA